jgi:hypothetical protein
LAYSSKQFVYYIVFSSSRINTRADNFILMGTVFKRRYKWQEWPVNVRYLLSLFHPSAGPIGRKAVRGDRWQGTNIDVKRKKAILHVELPENSHHLIQQERSSYKPLPHVLVVHPMSQPNCYPYPGQVFCILEYNHGGRIPVVLFVLNIAAVADAK